MPFGKYKGTPVEDLPADYLTWLWENVDLREPLRTVVENALSRQWSSPPASPQVTRGDLKAIYRRMACKWHPDHGGSSDAMAAVNEFYEELTANK